MRATTFSLAAAVAASALDACLAAPLNAIPESIQHAHILQRRSALRPIKPRTLRPRAPDVEVPEGQVVSLTRRQTGAGSMKATSSPLRGIYGASQYVVDVQLGSSVVSLVADTGSSDTWVVGTGFTCVNGTDLAVVPQEQCGFNSTYDYTSEFNSSIIANTNFNVSYGDGEFVIGDFGFENVTLANLTVRQQVAVASEAYWFGTGYDSGLMGLAYPLITSEYPGDDPSLDTPTNSIQYDPIMTTMFKQHPEIEPIFSLSLQRSPSINSIVSFGGYIALGGLPPVKNTSSFVTTPLVVWQAPLQTHPDWNTPKVFYSIDVQGVQYQDESGAAANTNQNFTAFVDSGTTLLYLPNDVSDVINSAFQPPAQLDRSSGVYFVECTAQAPSNIGLTIGGQTFVLNPADLILSNGDGTCTTGIAPAETEGSVAQYVLGDVFLKSVIAVFDVGASEMRFAAANY